MMCIVPAEVGRTAPHGDAKDQWKWAVEGLKPLADVARKCKVKIGLEPLNRFETNFLNRCDQALALAKEIGDDVGVVLDAFHINIEEEDPVAAIRAAGKKLVDFHVADTNRRPPGQGHHDWGAIIGALKEIGYQGTLTSEFVNPVDRTPVSRKPAAWGGMLTAEGASAAQLKFIQDHGSGVLSEAEYDKAVEETIQYLRKFVK
jgi:sugar phosphate isomerase/epimerase